MRTMIAFLLACALSLPFAEPAAAQMGVIARAVTPRALAPAVTAPITRLPTPNSLSEFKFKYRSGVAPLGTLNGSTYVLPPLPDSDVSAMDELTRQIFKDPSENIFSRAILMDDATPDISRDGVAEAMLGRKITEAEKEARQDQAILKFCADTSRSNADLLKGLEEEDINPLGAIFLRKNDFLPLVDDVNRIAKSVAPRLSVDTRADIAQDAFARLVGACRRIMQAGSDIPKPFAYFARIVVNVVKTKARTLTAERNGSCPISYLSEDYEKAVDRAASTENPECLVSAGTILAKLSAILSPRENEVLHLRLAGLSGSQIAKTLGIGEDRVKELAKSLRKKATTLGLAG